MKAFLATFPTTLHAWAAVAEHKYPFSPLPPSMHWGYWGPKQDPLVGKRWAEEK